MNPKTKQDVKNSIYAATAPIEAVNDIQEDAITALEEAIADLEEVVTALEEAMPDKLEFAAVPATASSTGTAGQIAYASGYLYVCVATNTWQRAELATWA